MDHIVLRSSRSRSRTPFLEQEILENESNEVITSVRVTRSATYRTYESHGSEEISSDLSTQKLLKTKNNKSIANAKYVTSDYSSEDGENEVSSTRHIDQNIRNQYLEESNDSFSNSNGNSGRLSALKVYKEAGEYWNRYPKTDYTYSLHSKDRVEIAPGVINMPNMSRKSLHSYINSTMGYAHKESNTDSSIIHESDRVIPTPKKIQPRSLFSNNNYQEYSTYKSSRSSSSYEESIITRIFTRILTIFTSIFVFSSRVLEKPNAWFIFFGRVLHRFASRLMLLDTLLLRGNNQRNQKVSLLFGLCLLPLLFLGGWWLMSGLSQTISQIYTTDSTLPIIIPIIKTEEPYAAIKTIPVTAPVLESVIKIKLDSPVQAGVSNAQLAQIADAIKQSFNVDIDRDTIIKIILDNTNVVRVENPTADAIAASFSPEQLQQMAAALDLNYDVNQVVQRVLESPSVQNVINNYNNVRDNDALSQMQLEIDELKQTAKQLRTDNAAFSTHFNYRLNRCCRKKFIDIEGYVTKLLRDILGAPSHVTNKDDMGKWMRSLFVAKHELESRLGNLTRDLKGDFDALVADNGRLIMGEVAKRLTAQIHTGVDASLPDEAHVLKIVKRALAIYDADKTGLVDYALESSGGQVISTRCTQSYQDGNGVVSVFGIPLWHVANTPRVVITPGVTPGECWAFENFPGFLLIKLSGPISIEAFSYEHVSKRLTPSGHIDSAPKSFAVYGLREESDREPTLIGEYIFDGDGDSLQFFAAQVTGLVFDLIELRVLSNHGNPNYTCLYRFRVHGKYEKT